MSPRAKRPAKATLKVKYASRATPAEVQPAPPPARARSTRTALILIRDDVVAVQAAVRIIYRILEHRDFGDVNRPVSVLLRRSVLALLDNLLSEIDTLYAESTS